MATIVYIVHAAEGRMGYWLRANEGERNNGWMDGRMDDLYLNTMKIKATSFYNIPKAKSALWLANSASTICPWVYADDVLNN